MSAYKLVIVESPAKAKTIGKFLGRGYKVEASQGHVRDLPKSQFGVDVENNFEPKYITIRGRGDILDKIKKEAKNATRIFLATDPDREGEAISWHLAGVLGVPATEDCRVEFHEVTSKAVKAAIKQSRPIDKDLVDAQQARRVLDRLVGYKISPLLWAKIKKGLSAGRVQSVATSIICEREREIEQFVPEEFWNLSARFSAGGVDFKARFHSVDGKRDVPSSKEAAEALVKRAKSHSYSITSVKKSERKKNPTAPFTTSNLQQEASRKLGFTTQKTMQIAQQLYEGVEIQGEGAIGLVTYIRTDSVRISEEAIDSVRGMILGTYGSDHLPETPNVYKSRKSAQDAHEAIRPTDIALTPDKVKASLTRDQLKLYKLIYSRFVASQMMPVIYDVLAAEVEGGGVAFHFTVQKMKFPGFTLVYEELLDDVQAEQDEQLPLLEEGMTASLKEIDSEQKFTQPPPRYTEASLIRTLEELGIGRPSTYAPTITTIMARGYIVRENKRLLPTELGIVVTDVMKRNFPDIVDLTFTAEMEDKLDEIEEGKMRWKAVIEDFYGPFAEALQAAEANIEKVSIEDQVSDIPCEKCGAMMVYKMGRYGKFLACPNFPECRHTMALLKDIGVPCPECGARLLERVSRKGRKFYGCEKYPDCAFVSWDLPVTELCAVCGGRMVLKRGKKNELFHVCVSDQCRNRVLVESPGGADAEDE